MDVKVDTGLDKGRFSCRFWIGLEFMVLVAFSTYTLQKLFRGEKFSNSAIIFTVCILCVSVLTLFGTFLCFLMYQRKLHHIRSSIDVSPLMKRINEDTDSLCAVCLNPRESFKTPVVTLTCNHKFHDGCIRECLQNKHRLSCPLCRSEPTKFPAPLRLLAFTKTVVMTKVIPHKERLHPV